MLFLLLLLLLPLFGACGGGRDGAEWRATLAPTPKPRLAEPDPAFAEKTAALEAAIATALGERPVDPARLAAAEGELGFFYLAYFEIEAAKPCFQNAAIAGPADWRWPYLLGFIGQMRGELEEAAAGYGAAVALSPQETGPRLRLAETRLEQGQLAEAGQQLAEILRRAPDLPAALFQEARRLDRQGDAKAAAPLLEKVVAAQPDAGTAHYLLGQLYRKLGREADARRELAASGGQRVRFDDPLLRRLDEMGVSEGFYRQRAARDFKAGDYAAAAAGYRRLFEFGPGRFGDRQRFAYALYLRGEKEAAAAELRLARARPDAAAAPAEERAEVHRLAALLLLEKNDRGGAIGELRQAVAALPLLPAGHEAARLMLADTLVKNGEPATALAVYDDWLRLELSARALLERGLLRLSRSDSAGLADVRRAAELAPGDPILQRRSGEIFERQGDLAAARSSFAAAVRDLAPPRDAETAMSRGFAYAHLANLERRDGRLAEAEKLYRQGLELLPALELRLNLADLLVRRGAFAEAAELYAAASAQDAGSVEARSGEAAALILAGEFAAARKALEKGVAELPRAGELRHLLARLLASAPEASDRDAARALSLALEVVQAKATSQHAETLAVALAENGRFQEAAGLLRELIAEGKKRERKPLLDYWQSQLDAYQNGRPFRATPPARFFRPPG